MTLKVEVNSIEQEQDENVERGNWSGKCDFLLSLMGYAIGIGAAWRFPYMCYRNGGGAFLVPYFIMLFLCGMPLFFMETALGQFTSLGAINVFKISPLLKGTGYATVLICVYLAIYYNVIISYIIFYLVLSLTSVLPWDNCNNEWNTPECTTAYKFEISEQKNESLLLETFQNNSSLFQQTPAIFESNDTMMMQGVNYNISFNQLKSPAHEFFYIYVLNITDGIHDLDSINQPLAVCLLVAWVLVYLCLIKGVKTVGKVVYFTATFPYLVLTILLIRGLTLPGSVDGIIYYIYPEWHKLLTFKVWADAALQVFYSLGPGWGGLVTMASFNRFHKNCYREAVAVPLINVFTAILAGFVVFSILGYLSHQTGIPIDKVATGGPGLAFIVYPEAVSLLPAAPVWSFMFFFMMLTLGLDSQFVTIETIVAAVWDELPTFLRERRIILSTAICMIMFLSGLICVTRGGLYIVQLLDWYSANLTVILICVVESIALCWIYGVHSFARDIEFMLNKSINKWWILSWKFSTPLILITVLIISIVDNTPVTFGTYKYPDWAVSLGWSIAASSMLTIPAYIIYKFSISPGSVQKRLKLFYPDEEFGPALSVHYQEWKEYCIRRQNGTPKLECSEIVLNDILLQEDNTHEPISESLE